MMSSSSGKNATPSPRPSSPFPPTATVLGLHRRLPRLFLLRWDNSKTNTRDSRKHEKQEAYGTLYPNGLVTLDTGSVFAMLGEMQHTLGLKGKFEVAYLDEQQQEEGGSA